MAQNLICGKHFHKIVFGMHAEKKPLSLLFANRAGLIPYFNWPRSEQVLAPKE